RFLRNTPRTADNRQPLPQVSCPTSTVYFDIFQMRQRRILFQRATTLQAIHSGDRFVRLCEENSRFDSTAVRTLRVVNCEVRARWMSLDRRLPEWLATLRAGVVVA